jgi:hypothetical protein
MIEVTKPQLWQFLEVSPESGLIDSYEAYVMGLEDDQPCEFAITKAQFDALKEAQENGELNGILVEQGFSETPPGGDTVVSIVEDVIEARDNGLCVVTWYGQQTQCLVASYDEDVIKVIE